MARTSPYGDLINIPGMKLPEWVFGGEFGDIENSIIVTENARRQSDAQALQNDQREAQLEEIRRQREFDDKLGGAFKEQQPATMRDMYRMGMEQALGSGRADVFMQMQEKLDNLDRQERQQKIQDINTAIAAGRINPEMAGQMMPELYTPEVIKRQQERNNLMGGLIYNPETGELMPKPRAGGSGGGGRAESDLTGAKDLVNPRTGQRKLVGRDQINDHYDAGWVPADSTEAMMAMADRMKGAGKEDQGGWFDGLFRAEPPPVPSAEAQRGGSARPQAAATPPPGAVVQQVIRRRAQENKGK